MKIDLYKMIIYASTILAVTHGKGRGGIPKKVLTYHKTGQLHYAA